MIRDLILAWTRALPIRAKLLEYVRESGVRAWLVGGTVRDALLGRESMDLDLAVEGDALAIAQRAANRFAGAFVPLDSDRDVGRVVLRVGDQHVHFDFAGLRAADINADLWARDYTVNAMAVGLDDDLALLDPTGGQADLQARLLRVTRADAYANDSLRVLRGIRLAGSLRFALTPETEALCKRHAPDLAAVSVERVRDELALVLALPDAAASLAYAAELGVLSVILPEFGHDAALLAHGTRAVAALEALVAPLWAEGSRAHVPPEDAAEVLVDYAAGLLDGWMQELTVGRTRWQACKLAALLSVLPGGPAAAEQSARRLHLAKTEMRLLRGIIQGREILLHLAPNAELEPLEVYRYYRETGDAGPFAAVLSLALASAPGYAEQTVERAALVNCVRQLLEAWFERHASLVEPPQLLSGHDLVTSLPVKPGPILGELIELLREVQVQGLVVTRHEALEYLRTYLLGQR
ncbi:MAG: CCA tRNA nucleotidyltransferase [Chloroflexi bacterium]|nr:CCA tRNA nucleotidyltransferase [Chloroflexota bacterium]